VLSNQK
jgi:hypothetical protein